MINPTETLFVNGVIRTMEDTESATSLLVRNDRIAGVGSESECRASCLTPPVVIDLAGAAVLPGFVDAHCHPLMYGQFSSWVNCSWNAAPSIDEVIALLVARADAQPSGAVRGEGFHHGNVREQRSLTRFDLDQVATDREVLVFHSSGHGAMVNTWALEFAGVGKDTPDPPGGHFGRDEFGVPNGEVWDAAADVLTGALGVKIANNGPNFHLADSADSLATHLRAAQQKLHAVGVTTVVDAQVTSRELGTYQQLRAAGGLTMRVEMLLLSSLLGELETIGLGGRLGDDLLAFSGVKLYVDGALTAATARFSEPYCCSTEDFGYFYHEPDELIDLIARAERLGLQTATHAQGDAAIEVVLQAHSEIQARGGRVDARHRIEHFGAPTSEQIVRTAELQLWPVTQPQYLRRYGDELIRVLEERAHRLCPLGEIRDAEVPLVISSDAPVCPPDPMEAVYSCVTRRTTAGVVLGEAEQKLTVTEALRAHTLGAAGSVHREASVGSLVAGKFADFIVLSADPVESEIAELLDIQVLQTWVGGQKVHDSKGMS